MNGLLGESWDDPKTQAVMQMAAGLLGGGNFGEALGRGLGGYQSVMKDAKASERQKIADDMAREQLAWKRDDRAREVAQQQQRQQAMGQLRQAMDSGQVTGQELLRLGIPMDLIKEAMSVKDMGRAEIARTIETEGPGGQKLVQGFDKFGAPVGQGAAGYVAPVQVSLGDRVGFMKPEAGVALPMGMSPEARDASARGWASNNLARQRFEFDQRGGADAVNGGKPPAGYRWKIDGSGLEAIPGGPADIKAGELGAKAEAKRLYGVAAAGGVRDTISDANNLVGWNTAGLGGVLSSVPATDARDLSAKLETIKANLGFDRLQQMRDQSPTGGALGNVAVQELAALQSTVASLDQKQSPEQLRKALRKVDEHYSNWQAVMRGENPYNKKPAGGSGINFVFNPETGKLESR